MRKSGRQRLPSRKLAEYVDLPPDILLASELDEEQRPSDENVDENIDEEDSEFPVELASDEQELETNTSGSEAESGNNLSNAIEVEGPEDNISWSPSESNVKTKLHTSKKKRPGTIIPRRRRGQYPGNQDISFSCSTEFDQMNKIALNNTRMQWDADSCLPARERMRLPFIYDNEELNREAREGWDWYFDHGGQEKALKQQEVRVLSPEEGLSYISGTSQDLLVGPYGSQRLVNLQHLRSIPLDTTDNFALQNSENLTIESDSLPIYKDPRHGWILNVGTRIKCLDWAPNHEKTQYLALASSSRPKSFNKESSKTAPAFTPAPSAASSIQIWSFPTSRSPNVPSRNQGPTAPKLIQVLCSDWGSITELRWCPTDRAQRQPSDLAHNFIGLLAVISADGYTRVLSINLTQYSPTAYLQIRTAFFSTRPPDLITTTLSWLSPIHIATAHSDGSISTHDISLASKPPSSQHSSTNQTIPPPYTPSPTLTLAHAYPTYPTILATSSVAGHTRLLDLRSPLTDHKLMPRTRFPLTNLIFSPHFAYFLHHDEADGTLRATSIGSWGVKGGSHRVRKTNIVNHAAAKSDGRKTGSSDGLEIGIGPLGRGCLDSGKVHTCIAWGGADGKVMVCNPLKSVLGSKRANEKDWLVCVSRLEWVRRKEVQAETSQAVNGSDERRDGDVRMREANEQDQDGDGSGERRGISRITQSYKAEKADQGPARGEKLKQITVFEEENAVTAVCWNPNLRCGGWLAVGWGNGLVRIEDVAV